MIVATLADWTPFLGALLVFVIGFCAGWMAHYDWKRLRRR